MTWANLPSVRPAFEHAIELAGAQTLVLYRSKPVVFLCGKADSDTRNALKAEIHERRPDIRVVFAEAVWSTLYDAAFLNALEMEETLAAVADCVVIVVESAGTIAELGAFSVNQALRKKLLLVMDREFEFGDSFLNTGPVRWARADSQFGPPVWTAFPPTPADLRKVVSQLDTQLPVVGRHQPKAKVGSQSELFRKRLFFLCDLTYLIGPCTRKHLEEALARAKPDLVRGDVKLSRWIVTYLAMAQALGFVNRVTRAGRADIYYRPVRDLHASFLSMKPTAKLHAARARWLYASTRVQPGRYALNAMKRDVE